LVCWIFFRDFSPELFFLDFLPASSSVLGQGGPEGSNWCVCPRGSVRPVNWMKPTPHRKCQHCRRAYTPDYRNRKRQKYCQQPDCRKAAKAACQRVWLTKPENQDYFRGPDNTRRVQQWRLENPEPRKPTHRQLPSLLQDPLKAEAAEQQLLTASAKVDALQEICFSQHALFV
jgi:hypothetical protein